ncbi:hypothetical protein PC116_g23950 [Phytophthora cactorum]|uniref:Uncharacterized protein n=1 Tax=Phytophthora cactorum TaxID=29920 RepID=A0A8T1JSC3_9STRA|nr:hypothetical protein PC118_g18061 [Phytophthora cactorum]KAG3003887.1 hypothetical protein PC119_g15796 [Phytophthora cactorum]KAG4227669.1 hypothetical protein PC116_g23950 [Phytophthora cactorum]
MSLGRAALFKGRNEADIGGGTGVGDAASQAVATRRRDPGAVSATNATVRLVSTSDVKPSNSKSLLRRRIWRTWQRSRCRAR